MLWDVDEQRAAQAANELGARVAASREEALAADLLEPSASDIPRDGWLAIAVDRSALERELRVSLEDALESAPRPRRGRPSSTRPSGRSSPAG